MLFPIDPDYKQYGLLHELRKGTSTIVQ
jgi:hypothetical protein